MLYHDSPFFRAVQHALDAKGMFYHVEDYDPVNEIGDKVPVMRIDNRVYNFEQALAWVDSQPNYPLD